MLASKFRNISTRSLRCSCLLKKRIATNVQDELDPAKVKPIARWLFGLSAMVAGMVTVGGITRLTRSGLSMTDWKLQGSLPPMNPEEWDKEFERYKSFPEWQQRQSMTVEEFKFIYFWEYGHRMLGRFLGLAFVGPLAYFGARGLIPRSLYPRLALLFGLGGGQGLIGWWMVKSGLEMDPKQRKEIRVSPYRLATHLGMAFTTFTTLLWTGLDLVNPLREARKVASSLSPAVLTAAQVIRKHALVNVALVGTTVLSGAFVAGNDAGRAYNSFPLMGDQWIPDEILDMNPLWRNFFENTATVQFDHRTLAITTLTSIAVMFARARKASQGLLWENAPRFTRAAITGTMHMSVVQVGLGITTLLLYVPIDLAVAHQAGSLILLTLVTTAAHSLRFASAAARVSNPATIGVAAAAGVQKIIPK